jgi:hypothetical protein
LVDGRGVEPPGGRPLDSRSELRRVEGLGRTGALADEQRSVLDPLVSGEAPPARQALSPAADRYLILRKARIDDLVVVRPAGGTAHENTVIGSI